MAQGIDRKAMSYLGQHPPCKRDVLPFCPRPCNRKEVMRRQGPALAHLVKGGVHGANSYCPPLIDIEPIVMVGLVTTGVHVGSERAGKAGTAKGAIRFDAALMDT